MNSSVMGWMVVDDDFQDFGAAWTAKIELRHRECDQGEDLRNFRLPEDPS